MSIDPSIDLIIGPMYAGKTTELLRMLNLFVEFGVNTLYINSNIDTRSSMNFSTHNPTIKSVGKVDSLKISNLENIDICKYHVIGIDEAQFFPNLKKWVLTHPTKKFIISGLNGDYMKKPFGEIQDLLPHCDSIKFLHPFCKLCTDRLTPASFTKRISLETDTVSVNAQYIPVCRKCYDLV